MAKTTMSQPVEATDMRERILDAALETFAERGYEGATLNRIASRSGSTTPLIVYHFKNKSDLWRAVVTMFIKRHASNVDDVLGSSELGAGERLRHFIARNVEFMARRPELHRLIANESYEDTERLRWLVNSLVKPYYGRMIALIEEAQREGSVRKLDAHRLRYAILGVISLPAVAEEYTQLTGKDPRSPEEVRQSIQFLYDLIFC